MVEPPWISPPVNILNTAFTVRPQSTPLWVQNRRSSIATAASMRSWGISSKSTQIELVVLSSVVISTYCPVVLS